MTLRTTGQLSYHVLLCSPHGVPGIQRYYGACGSRTANWGRVRICVLSWLLMVVQYWFVTRWLVENRGVWIRKSIACESTCHGPVQPAFPCLQLSFYSGITSDKLKYCSLEGFSQRTGWEFGMGSDKKVPKHQFTGNKPKFMNYFFHSYFRENDLNEPLIHLMFLKSLYFGFYIFTGFLFIKQNKTKTKYTVFKRLA